MKLEIFEEHSSVLPAWWALGARPRTIVYLDAHLDLQHIGDERIAQLRQCRSADELRALEKPHPLYPDSGGAYSLEDWIFPAHRLGLIERLVWVSPPHVGDGASAHALAQLQQMDGVTPEELRGVRRAEGGWVEGRLLGIPICIVNLQQLARLPLPPDSLIDIDIDYFITVPDDVPWISPREVFEVLAALPLRPPLITLSRSVGSGFTPLRYRFIADWLAALWQGRDEEAAHWERLFALDRRWRDGEREAIAREARAELERHPHCAASWHLLGLASVDRAEGRAAQAAAEAACAAYAPTLLRRACETRHRQHAFDLASLLALQQELEGSRADAATEALGWAALGLLHAGFDRIAAADDCLTRCSRHFGAHPELALAVGRLMLRRGEIDAARDRLHMALGDDKTHTAALVMLAQADGRQGRPDRALEKLRQAAARAPAWVELHRQRDALAGR